MNFKANAISKSILILIACTLIGWTYIGYAAEQWDARATTRVNLRTSPGPSGVILSIVPQGQRVRILEIKGPWCRVDVEGDVYGKGWIYGEYLEGFLPKDMEAEPLLRADSDEDTAQESIQTLNPIAESSDVPTNGVELQTADVPTAAKVFDSSQKEQISIQNQPQKSKIKHKTQPRVESSGTEASVRLSSFSEQPKFKTKDENTAPEGVSHFDPVQAPGPQQPVLMQNEIQEPQNGPILPSQQDPPKKIIEPVLPGDADLKQSASGKHLKSTSSPIEQFKAASHPKKLPTAEKKQIASTANTSALTGLKVEAATRSGAPSLGLTTSPFRRIKPVNQPGSMGPVEMLLKLLSLALSCFVILLLHRSNKIATKRYDALMYVQGLLEKRQSNT